MSEKKEQIIKDYSKTAQVYDLRYEEIQKQKYLSVLPKIKITAPVLDLGCGTGLLQKFLDKDLFGCDLVLSMATKALDAGEKVVVADMDFLPFQDGSFNTILSFTALQNLPDPEKALAEAKRVLAPDGIFALTFLKKFDEKISPLIEKHFTVKEKFESGEDICFIINVRP